MPAGTLPKQLPAPWLSLLLIAGLAGGPPPARADFRRSAAVPPPRAELDLLQEDYDRSSRELLGSFEQLRRSAPGCGASSELPPMLARGSAWQKRQRETVLGSLASSAQETETEILKLDDIAIAGSANGLPIVADARTAMSSGVERARSTVDRELRSVQAFHGRLAQTKARASRLLPGKSSGCAAARDLFENKLAQQSLLVAARLRALSGALEKRKRDLLVYADSVDQALSGERHPASSIPFPY